MDPLVEESVIVELKAIKAIADIHRAECINYLRAAGLQVCLLRNFGNPRLEIKRIPGLRPAGGAVHCPPGVRHGN